MHCSVSINIVVVSVLATLSFAASIPERKSTTVSLRSRSVKSNLRRSSIPLNDWYYGTDFQVELKRNTNFDSILRPVIVVRRNSNWNSTTAIVGRERHLQFID